MMLQVWDLLSQAYMMMTSLRAKSPLESECMNFLHFLFKIYMASFAVCFNGLKRSYRGLGHHNEHCCGTTFIFQWGYGQAAWQWTKLS